MRGLVIRSCLVAATFVSLGCAARADEFLNQEGDMWRASKLVGVNVYGPDQKKVGDINDVLMGKDGKAAFVVVGVGGFLGIGEKNVAIPFDKVSFTQEPINPPTTAGTAAPATNNMAANSGMAPAAGAGMATPAQTNNGATGTAAVGAAPANGTAAPMPARSTAYPDHGTVTYTADQLKAAPTFAYAK